jgi:hypothetical protein
MLIQYSDDGFIDIKLNTNGANIAVVLFSPQQKKIAKIILAKKAKEV